LLRHCFAYIAGGASTEQTAYNNLNVIHSLSFAKCPLEALGASNGGLVHAGAWTDVIIIIIIIIIYLHSMQK